MPGTELRGDPARTRIGPQRGRLRNAAIVFEQISSDVGARPSTWIVAVGVALDGLADAWEEHVAFTEGPDGLFEELLDDSVEVAPEKLTASGAVPLRGAASAFATGAVLPGAGFTVSVRSDALFVSFVSNTAASESAVSRNA